MTPTSLFILLATICPLIAGCGEQPAEHRSGLPAPQVSTGPVPVAQGSTPPPPTVTAMSVAEPFSSSTSPVPTGVDAQSAASDASSMGPAATTSAPPSGGASTVPGAAGDSSRGGASAAGGAPSNPGGMAGAQGGVVSAQGGATGGASQGGEPSAVSQGGTSTGGGGVADGTCPEGAPVPDPNLLTKCSGSGTLQCVFGGDPGHYDVSFLLGGDTEGTTTITAESRRFMFPQTVTAAGESRCVSFTVNVREPEGQPIQDVSPGTPGLNFRLGPEARVQAIGVRPAVDPVVVYIAGDSTVCDQDPQLGAPPEQRYTGWGQMLPQYFGPGVSVANYADSGEGTSAFRPDGGSLWARIADQMGSGDYLLIHLGHNDKTTPAATYASRITAMVQYAKGVGATPVLFSPIARNTGGTLDQQHIYGDLVVRNELSKIAQTEQVAYVDLTAKTFAWMQELGSTEAQTYFVLTDKTHTNELGADLFAQMVVEGLREENVALTTFLR